MPTTTDEYIVVYSYEYVRDEYSLPGNESGTRYRYAVTKQHGKQTRHLLTRDPAKATRFTLADAEADAAFRREIKSLWMPADRRIWIEPADHA